MDDNKTRTVNLTELFLYVLSKWRTLIAGALIGAVLLGLGGIALAKRNVPSEASLKAAQADYEKDLKKGKYNPFIAMGQGKNWQRWEEYLVMTMGRCTAYFEKLPLVQDKDLLDNILYSGVWVNYRGKRKEADQND